MMKSILKILFVNKKTLRYLLTALMLIGVSNVFFIRSAMACVPYSQTITPPASISLNPGLPVGTVVATATLSWPTFNTGSGGCPVPYATGSHFGLTGMGTPNGNLYPTGIDGLSYRGKINGGWPSNFFVYWPASVTQPGPYGSGVGGGSVLIEFVKTGPLTSGTFNPQVLMHATLDSVPWFDIYMGSPMVIKPTVPACTVTQSAITVNLDDGNTSQLATAGNTSKDKTFSIPLNCTSASNISLTFSGDIVDSSNAVFRNLSGSANAASVGIQILSGSTPVPTTAGTYLNLGAINGSTTVPLIARYYALANNPDVGTVSAIAYATIVYN